MLVTQDSKTVAIVSVACPFQKPKSVCWKAPKAACVPSRRHACSSGPFHILESILPADKFHCARKPLSAKGRCPSQIDVFASVIYVIKYMTCAGSHPRPCNLSLWPAMVVDPKTSPRPDQVRRQYCVALKQEVPNQGYRAVLPTVLIFAGNFPPAIQGVARPEPGPSNPGQTESQHCSKCVSIFDHTDMVGWLINAVAPAFLSCNQLIRVCEQSITHTTPTLGLYRRKRAQVRTYLSDNEYEIARAPGEQNLWSSNL